ncbi:hypothetical protein J437_LFUL002823 [Ladona fulva]|uniref:Uncharacterized protein n=1 Tax=Ladona fulva TaxID=123851 RepID=A0A8K0JSD0_LADFU|nr:hypothetical protein J437_LFUL002823 [Ladona fulva]
MGFRMSLNNLDAYLDKVKENMRTYSEEQGKRFQQDTLDFESLYQGYYDESVMRLHSGAYFTLL